MFYRQCGKCGERWEFGTASTCKCKDAQQQKPVQELMQKAYLAGFLASGDGYNGQCPFDQCGQQVESDEDCCIDRDDALRQLLEQPEPVQEPDAEFMHEPDVEVLRQQMKGRAQFLRDRGEVKTPQLLEIASELITPPAQPAAWVGLTDEDIAEAGQLNVEGPRMLPYAFARAIEAKLREKNGGAAQPTDHTEEYPDMVRALEELLEVQDEPCRIDHQGYCQSHYLDNVNSHGGCRVANARALVAKVKGGA